MKNYNFRPIFHNFNENFGKNVSNFWRKFGKNFEVFIYTGFGGRSPLKLAILLKNSQKSNGKLVFFENFHKLSKKSSFSPIPPVSGLVSALSFPLLLFPFPTPQFFIIIILQHFKWIIWSVSPASQPDAPNASTGVRRCSSEHSFVTFTTTIQAMEAAPERRPRKRFKSPSPPSPVSITCKPLSPLNIPSLILVLILPLFCPFSFPPFPLPIFRFYLFSKFLLFLTLFCSNSEAEQCARISSRFSAPNSQYVLIFISFFFLLNTFSILLKIINWVFFNIHWRGLPTLEKAHYPTVLAAVWYAHGRLRNLKIFLTIFFKKSIEHEIF